MSNFKKLLLINFLYTESCYNVFCMDQTDAFQKLSHDDILNAIDAAGYRCSGHIYPLNSYENRVYQVGLEDANNVIAKFYRPGRWSDDAIIEEHNFTTHLSNGRYTGNLTVIIYRQNQS